jgi:hypothetical protein
LDTKLNAATVHDILGYFVRSPQAADTLEGIARWRLLDAYITRKVEETQCALDWLVAEGYLLETRTAGAGLIYSLNPDRADAARDFLSRAESGDTWRDA